MGSGGSQVAAEEGEGVFLAPELVVTQETKGVNIVGGTLGGQSGGRLVDVPVAPVGGLELLEHYTRSF